MAAVLWHSVLRSPPEQVTSAVPDTSVTVRFTSMSTVLVLPPVLSTVTSTLGYLSNGRIHGGSHGGAVHPGISCAVRLSSSLGGGGGGGCCTATATVIC